MKREVWNWQFCHQDSIQRHWSFIKGQIMLKLMSENIYRPIAIWLLLASAVKSTTLVKWPQSAIGNNGRHHFILHCSPPTSLQYIMFQKCYVLLKKKLNSYKLNFNVLRCEQRPFFQQLGENCRQRKPCPENVLCRDTCYCPGYECHPCPKGTIGLRCAEGKYKFNPSIIVQHRVNTS